MSASSDGAAPYVELSGRDWAVWGEAFTDTSSRYHLAETGSTTRCRCSHAQVRDIRNRDHRGGESDSRWTHAPAP
eukprot:4645837-Prymnesium_polylepis.2